MDTRRDFIKKSAIIGTALCLPVSLTRESIAAYPDLKTHSPKKVLILWYSQTGNTNRYARLIGCILKSKNIAVDELEFQETDKKSYLIMILSSLAVLFFIMIPLPMSVIGWKKFHPSREHQSPRSFPLVVPKAISTMPPVIFSKSWRAKVEYL